jgi:uncharacterized DUF497 family protein
MNFEWNQNKATANLEKHGVSFEEARTVFADEFGRYMHDPDHSIEEDRFLLLGLSNSLKLLMVVHVEANEDSIRIISARKATKKESELYRRFKQ